MSENLKLILIGMILILMIVAGAIVISLYFGGDVSRQLVVSEIKGSAYTVSDNKKLAVGKGSRLKSGDILITEKDAAVRISIDDDKYVFVEPNSELYIYYTDIASKGDISVNLSRGAVICQLNSKLGKNAGFTLKTPNSAVSVRGTVFRTQFDYEESYMGYSGVMITQVQNFDGSVTLQLYDSKKEPFDLPMLLVERTAAQMITAENICQYGYLNYDIDLLSLSEDTLHEILRARNEKQLGFSHEEINAAYRLVVEENRRLSTMTEISSDMTETTVPTAAPTTTFSSKTTTGTIETPASVTEPPKTEEESSGGTLRTTQRTHEYTTYSGIRWWELTGNTNTADGDYEDWFTEEPENPSEYVTTVPAAEE